MATKTITCPSGLQGEIRNLKAKEMSMLADPANAHAIRSKGKKGKGHRAHPLDPIYSNIWLSTANAGPYGFAQGQPVPWPKVLTCDRFFTLLHVRDLTWGPYEFRVPCRTPACPRQKQRFLWELDLNQLEFKELPEESRTKVAASDLVFDLQLGGKACKFKLLTGSDEINAPTLSDDVPTAKKLLAQVATRLFSIEGIKEGDDDARVEWVGELDVPDLYAASHAMEAVDGGVETRTRVVCPECDEEFTVDIPFGDAAFLAPTPT